MTATPSTTLTEGAGTVSEADCTKTSVQVEVPAKPVEPKADTRQVQEADKQALRWYEGYRAGYFC